MSYYVTEEVDVESAAPSIITHTSLEVKGTIIPTVPDSVVYTITSEPPGIKVVLWREWMVSPT